MKVIYSKQDRIAFVTLNSPQNLNAFDEEMIMDAVEVLRQCEEDKEVKIVVLTGAGKAFSAGGDIGAMYKGIKSGQWDFSKDIEKMAKVSLAIKKMSKPVIASVRGAAAGAGCNVALACDFCVATEDSMFIQAFVNVGLIPDAGGMYLLTRAVGVNRAVQLAMTGRPVSAKEAQALGIVSQVCAPEELDQATLKLAKQLARGPSLSYAYIKKLTYESEFKDFEAFIPAEVHAQSECGKTQDFIEGVMAFVEKRSPKFE
ncbi:enoyl-CoA hydratase/isomerase family protein [Papillibacter cinnamivorans]|uniref:Enoyl-CoA hydratase/carnithine racemase n=1 Tax=Papillibacter cinnamivorans DSM 12816 TaxID=1122930 RepID=A0A1W2C2P3_9FIRM|nr:enoyl-CoA hydratase-related protein [Papillibacter cinnamivorans]SMC79376.1 Enoyl-CoA hydratase/carnithine racemase [Papillibacter cinnamivorans DSM 12816]